MIAARRRRADELAWFVVAVGMSPADYRTLTIRERAAILRTYQEAHP